MTPATTPRKLIRICATTGVMAVLGVLATVSPASAASSTNCGKQVIADWWNNGRVDKQYDLHCYREAIDDLPEDLKVYGQAEEEISRALLARRANPTPSAPPPPSSPPPSPPTSTPTTPDDPAPPPPSPPPVPPSADPGIENTSGPSSVPVPLIVLGSLAVLLLVAGSAGYLLRRFRNSGSEPPTA